MIHNFLLCFQLASLWWSNTSAGLPAFSILMPHQLLVMTQFELCLPLQPFPKAIPCSMVSGAQSLLSSVHWMTGIASKFSLLPQSLGPHNKAVLSLKCGSKDHLCQLALHCSPLWRGSTLITLTSEDISVCRRACADLLTSPTWFLGLVHFWK